LKFGVKDSFHHSFVFDVGKHDHLGQKPKVQPNTSIKGPHLSVFPKSTPQIGHRFPQPKSPTDFLRVTCCHADRRDDDRYVMIGDDQALPFLYINLLR
jgi:hypothetical protein